MTRLDTVTAQEITAVMLLDELTDCLAGLDGKNQLRQSPLGFLLVEQSASSVISRE